MSEELGRLYEQLESFSKNKSQFLASMSHELRTPLNAIIGLSDMLVKHAARFGTDKAAEPLHRIHRAGTHLFGLVNQVLDISKIEAGKLELSPEQVNLVALLDDVAGTARQLAEQKSNRLSVDHPSDLGSLMVDPMRLRQILLNLLSNACKFTEHGQVSPFLTFLMAQAIWWWCDNHSAPKLLRERHQQVLDLVCRTYRASSHQAGAFQMVMGLAATARRRER